MKTCTLKLFSLLGLACIVAALVAVATVQVQVANLQGGDGDGGDGGDGAAPADDVAEEVAADERSESMKRSASSAESAGQSAHAAELARGASVYATKAEEQITQSKAAEDKAVEAERNAYLASKQKAHALAAAAAAAAAHAGAVQAGDWSAADESRETAAAAAAEAVEASQAAAAAMKFAGKVAGEESLEARTASNHAEESAQLARNQAIKAIKQQQVTATYTAQEFAAHDELRALRGAFVEETKNPLALFQADQAAQQAAQRAEESLNGARLISLGTFRTDAEQNSVENAGELDEGADVDAKRSRAAAQTAAFAAKAASAAAAEAQSAKEAMEETMRSSSAEEKARVAQHQAAAEAEANAGAQAAAAAAAAFQAAAVDNADIVSTERARRTMAAKQQKAFTGQFRAEAVMRSANSVIKTQTQKGRAAEAIANNAAENAAKRSEEAAQAEREAAMAASKEAAYAAHAQVGASFLQLKSHKSKHSKKEAKTTDGKKSEEDMPPLASNKKTRKAQLKAIRAVQSQIQAAVDDEKAKEMKESGGEMPGADGADSTSA